MIINIIFLIIFIPGIDLIISIKKPYQKQCDSIEIKEEELNIDFGPQSNETCPLPSEIGCICDSDHKKVKCVYTNVLNKIPKFVEDDMVWNIDLRCKNLSQANDLTGLLPLKQINTLDMSGFLNIEEFNKHCKWSTTSTVVNLTTFGHSVYDTVLLNDKKTQYLELLIDNLNLNWNRIEKIHLNRINLEHYAGGLSTNLKDKIKYSFKIKNISLKYNNLEDLNNIKYNLDVCYLGLESLDASYNRIKLIDMAFLIYLTNLNMSNNHLKSFSVYFFEEPLLSNDCSNIKWFNVSDNSTFGKNTTKIFYISKLKHLDFSYNHLVSVPFSHLKINFTNLEYLNLKSNKLTYLHAYDFSTMKHLKHLNLDHNRFLEIDSKAFAHLIHLKHFDLNSNCNGNLALPAKMFKDPGKTIAYLSLDYNHLMEVPKSTLIFCFSVKQLYLNGNQIRVLPNFSFGFMYSLLELYLSNNLIEQIEPNTFSIDEEALIGPGLIEKLDLSYNRLTSLDANMFAFLTNLRYLLLNNNLIKDVDVNALYGNNNLIMLDLGINRIKRLDFLSNRNLSNLRFLKLSNNEINKLRPAQFICLKGVKTLDLSSNKIKRITDCAFHGLQNTIKKLILNYNKITKLNSCAFSLNFFSLRFVQIAQNPLKCTSSCEFYFPVFSHPFSIDYTGLECESGSELFTIKHTSNFSYCSQNQYKRIYDSCRDINRFCTKNMTNYEQDCEYKPKDVDYYSEDDDHLDMLDPFRRRIVDNKATALELKLNILVILCLNLIIL